MDLHETFEILKMPLPSGLVRRRLRSTRVEGKATSFELRLHVHANAEQYEVNKAMQPHASTFADHLIWIQKASASYALLRGHFRQSKA